MNLEPVYSYARARSLAHRTVETRVSGRWLPLLRLGWVVTALGALVVLVASVPVSLAALQVPCAGRPCGTVAALVTARDVQALQQLGLSLGAAAAYWVALKVGVALVWMVVGSVLAWRKSDDWLVLLVALLLVVGGTNSVGDNLLNSASLWRIPATGVFALTSLTLLFTLALFPTGRFVPGWTGGVALLYPATNLVYLLFLRPLHLSGWSLYQSPLNGLAWFGCLGALTLAQIYRYRHVSTPLERQQSKWVAFSFVMILTADLGWAMVDHLPALQQSNLLYVLLVTLFLGLFLVFPLCCALAILRYRLWEIDLVLNRTLVYGALTACIVGLYVLVVGGLGTLLQAQGNLIIALLATGLVAVLFQPLRAGLQRAVNRLLFGERDTPYQVLARLGQRLEATLAADAVLPTLVETVAQALKLPYVAITLQQEEAAVIAAAHGPPQAELLRLPLAHQGEPLGELLLAPRAPGEPFGAADRALLSDLARQAGVAAHAVRLTTALQRLTGELQQARTQLVTAREEERRRLRRDLHDGLGAALTGVTFQLEAASNLLDRDPGAVKRLLEDLKGQTQAAIADIRRLVYNLRPPILDEWGLVAALREQAEQLQGPTLQVQVCAPEPFPALSAALEVAAYRIALEGLANVVRHAGAAHCTIRLDLTDDALTVEVQDDGHGVLPGTRAGVGINAMRERAAELGGSCVVEPRETVGTRVAAYLPRREE